MIEILYDGTKFFVQDPPSVSSLLNGFYGTMKKGKIFLRPEEVLYLLDVRNAICRDLSLNTLNFFEVMSVLPKKRLMSRYLTYKGWRDKGLIIRPVSELKGNYGKSIKINYNSEKFEPPSFSIEGYFSEDFVTVLDDENTGTELYERFWLGQKGTYKAHQRGKLSKLDVFETIFLIKHGNLLIKNKSLDELLALARRRFRFFDDLYLVYEDWRKRGYVVKTGFKFGTHFRLYFPGASPIRKDWLHSKHVIHVFPRKRKQLISEWARVIRVAHSVRKTFIMALPGKKVTVKRKLLDFALYHRIKGGIETPKTGTPKYVMYSLTEDQFISGEHFAKVLHSAHDYGLDVVVAIADRESSVTYYLIRKIVLEGSNYDYFEIEWIQP